MPPLSPAGLSLSLGPALSPPLQSLLCVPLPDSSHPPSPIGGTHGPTCHPFPLPPATSPATTSRCLLPHRHSARAPRRLLRACHSYPRPTPPLRTRRAAPVNRRGFGFPIRRPPLSSPTSPAVAAPSATTSAPELNKMHLRAPLICFPLSPKLPHAHNHLLPVKPCVAAHRSAPAAASRRPIHRPANPPPPSAPPSRAARRPPLHSRNPPA